MWGDKAKLKRDREKLRPRRITLNKKVKKAEKPKVKKVIEPVKKPRKLKTKPIKEAYKSKKKSSDPNKIEINNVISTYVVNDKNLKKGKAVILDADTMNTYKALTKIANYPTSKIVEVNHCEETYNKIAKVCEHAYNMSLGDYIKLLNSNEVSVMFADYCCSPVGNKDSRPLKDIENAFKKKIFMKPSLFALTFSWRGGKNIPSNYGSIMLVANALTKAAVKSGYKLIITPDGRSYNSGGSMFTLICLLL